MKPKIVIFDLDGTLIDCTDRYYQTYRDVLHQYRLKAPKKEELIKLRRLTGMSTREILSSYLIPRDLKKRDELVPEIAEKRIVMFEDWTYLKLDNTFPGVEETLEKLLGMDIALMLVTARRNRGNLIRQLEEKDLEKYFGKILCRNEFRERSYTILPVL
ncbi:MAG: HAD hydrolase-like protein [Nitrososphaeria archaeon]|nr:HAD hydrolase-like protein [Nitrososphaeria archaeon]NIQ33325.1 HAD hydrolase-like protein [Nitrososphaeria archaeon]